MNECTLFWLSYHCIKCTGLTENIISRLNLLKRNSNTTGSAQLSSSHSNFPRGSLLQTFCSRPDSPLTTAPVLHAPMVSAAQGALSLIPPNPSPFINSHCLPKDSSPCARNTEVICLGS